MRRLIMFLVLAAASGCAYGFEDDNAVFACQETADCAGDEVCGNHVLADRDALSICTEAERVPAIGLRMVDNVMNCTAFDPTADPATTPTGTWEANLTWSTTTASAGAAVQGADFGCDGTDNARDGGETACCIGGPQQENSGFQGRGSVLCFLAASALEGTTDNDPLLAALVLNYSVNGLSMGNGQYSNPIPIGNDAPIAWVELREVDWSIAGLPLDCP